MKGFQPYRTWVVYKAQKCCFFFPVFITETKPMVFPAVDFRLRHTPYYSKQRAEEWYDEQYHYLSWNDPFTTALITGWSSVMWTKVQKLSCSCIFPPPNGKWHLFLKEKRKKRARRGYLLSCTRNILSYLLNYLFIYQYRGKKSRKAVVISVFNSSGSSSSCFERGNKMH